MHKIIAIINPISGTVSKAGIPDLLNECIDKTAFNLEIKFTEYAGHATEIAKQAVIDGVHAVIAIGGDGTVNEIAGAVRDSDTAMGIIPMGSGNGLARHLGVPMNPRQAIDVINDNITECLDYCIANDHPFFCTCGIGFDAEVSKRFAESNSRGPLTYIKSALSEYLRYRSETYEIDTPQGIITQKAFLIACGNASQYGNNAFIAPNASMHDGMIDVTMMLPITPLDTALLGLLLFTKHLDQDVNIHTFRTPELTIHRKQAGTMHIDGEPIMMDADIHIYCKHLGLKLVTPTGKHRVVRAELPVERTFWDFINVIRRELKI